MSWPSKTSTGRNSRFSRNELLTDATILLRRDLLDAWSSLSLRAPHTEHLEGLLIRVRELMDLVRGDEDDIPLLDIPEGRDVINHRQELRPSRQDVHLVLVGMLIVGRLSPGPDFVDSKVEFVGAVALVDQVSNFRGLRVSYQKGLLADLLPVDDVDHPSFSASTRASDLSLRRAFLEGPSQPRPTG